MSRPADPLRSGARRILGRELGDAEATSVDNYLNLLSKWQKVHRLTGSASRAWAIDHIVLDSWLFLRALPERLLKEGSAGTLLDLGSGAGVPGVPLAIVRRTNQFVLVESRQRRASFLAEAVRSVPLPNARVVAERAEAVEQEMAGSVDAVVMRCAGDLAAVLPVAKRFVVPGGVVVASGPPDPVRVAGGEWLEVEGVAPGSARRFLVVPC